MLTDQQIEAAICASEIAGSGHLGDETYTFDDNENAILIRACRWHTAEDNEKVRRFIDELRARENG